MKAKIYIKGRITKGETLLEVISQYKSFEDVTEVEVSIDSNGGNKNEGDAIHDYLKNIDTEIPVTTKTGKAYSIAAKIFAAGSTRIVEDVDDALMIHFARAKTEGTAEELEEIAAELRIIEDDFIEFYSEHLNIDESTVRNLLDNETFVSGENAVDLGFATEVEKVAEIVAELNIEKSNINKMTKEKGFFKKLRDDITAYLNEVVSELTLQDSNATDIVFPDLENDGTPVKGDKATVDGKAIEDGSHIMPSMEDVTLVFVGGAVDEVIPKEEETEETDAEKKEGEVVAEEIKEVITYSVQAANTSFEEGEILMLEPWDTENGGEPYSANAGEWKLGDGRSVITDAAGVIVSTKTASQEGQVDEPETEASFDELKGKMSKKLKAEIKAEHDAELLKKENEITSLKAKIGSKEFIAEQKVVSVFGKKGDNKAASILQAARELNK